MNAFTLLSAVAPSTRDFWLMFADEVGMLPQFTCIIPGNWKHLTNEKILGVLRAAYPTLTVTWCDWAERPRDFSINGDVLLVKVLGEKGIPPRDVTDRRSSKEKYRRRRRETEEHWDADIEVRSRKDWLYDHVRNRRDPGLQALARVDATPIDVKCCGVEHTLSSYRALPMVGRGVEERDEGSTRILTEQRECQSCGATLTYVSTRILGGK